MVFHDFCCSSRSRHYWNVETTSRTLQQGNEGCPQPFSSIWTGAKGRASISRLLARSMDSLPYVLEFNRNWRLPMDKTMTASAASLDSHEMSQKTRHSKSKASWGWALPIKNDQWIFSYWNQYFILFVLFFFCLISNSWIKYDIIIIIIIMVCAFRARRKSKKGREGWGIKLAGYQMINLNNHFQFTSIKYGLFGQFNRWQWLFRSIWFCGKCINTIGT